MILLHKFGNRAPIIYEKVAGVTKCMQTMKQGRYILLAVILVIAASCESKHQTTIAFPQKVFVGSFPQRDSLYSNKTFRVETVALIDIAVKNRLLLLASSSDENKYISAYSLDDGSLVGSALKKGRANGELRGAKSFVALGLREYDDKLYSYTFDSQNNLIRIDLTESFSQNHTVFDVIAERSRLEMPRAIFCRDSVFLITSVSEDLKRRNRMLLHENGTSDVPAHLQLLNDASVRKSDDVNILSTLVAFNPNLQRVAEAGLQQNSIQLYSLYDDFAKTIVIGKRQMPIEELETTKQDLIRDQYVHVNAYNKYFAALYYDATEKEQHNKEKLPRLQFFSWEGEPICELLISFPASSFDIDCQKKKIYFLNRDSESITECSLPDCLVTVSN
jgi:hypothetical protein